MLKLLTTLKSRARSVSDNTAILRSRGEPFHFIGIMLVILLSVKAWVDVDTNWDTWSYHLPFAAKLWGIIDSAHYQFDPVIQQRWEGFPLLGEFIQGAFWRLTQHIEATNYLALFSLFGFCIFLYQQGRIPFYASLIVLMAVPLIHFNATTSYVDLPASLFFSMFFLLLYQTLVTPEKKTTRSLIMAALCAIVAGNIKTIFAVLSFVTWLVFLLAQRFTLSDVTKPSLKTLVLILLISLPLLFFVPIKNGILYQNPTHGVEIKIGQSILSTGENFSRDVPVAHLKTPGVLRWLISVSEIQNPPFTWNAGQTVNLADKLSKETIQKLHDHNEHVLDGLQQTFPYYRMGGFFSAYVLFQLLVFGLTLKHYSQKERNIRLISMTFLTLLAAFSPMSFHLRYVLYWMIILISFNMMHIWKNPHRYLNAGTYSTVSLLALLIVFWASGLREIIPKKYNATRFRQSFQDLTHWDKLPKSMVYCTETFPYSLVLTSYFAPSRDYKVEDAGPEHVASFKVTPSSCQY